LARSRSVFKGVLQAAFSARTPKSNRAERPILRPSCRLSSNVAAYVEYRLSWRGFVVAESCLLRKSRSTKAPL
jgi:hypothetical protein